MGKKSLTKSTSKKKTTKKKTTTAKSTSAKTETKKSSAQKTSSKKTTSGKKPSLKSLRKKDFGAWVPESLYAPEKPEEQFEAPPVIETTDEKTARHFRELLDRKFDAGTPAKKSAKKKTAAQPKKKQPAKSETQKKAPARKKAKKPATTKELLKKQFTPWRPEKPFVPASDAQAESDFAAPPFADNADADTFREILFREFDLSKVTPKPPPEPESKSEATPEPEAEAEASPDPEPEPEKTPEPAADKPLPSTAELLARKFDAWQPEKPFVPASDIQAENDFAAPPFADNADADTFREILFREFDLSKVTPKPPPEPEAVTEPTPASETKAEPEPESQAEPEPVKEEEASAESAAEAKPAPEAEPKAEPKAEPEPEPEPKTEPPKAEKSKPKTPPPQDKGKGGEPPQPPGGPGGPTEPPQPPEPMNQNLKRLIIGIAVVFALIILASALNSGQYYVKQTDSGVEVWKGDFSPLGQEKVIALKDVSPPGSLKGRVSKLEAYSLPFDYYMAKARKLSQKSGVPDFEAIRKNLEKAREYAVSNKQMQQVRHRLNHIEFTLLLNKADMTAAQESPEGYDKALDHLREARDLATTPSQRELVAKEIQKIRAQEKALRQMHEKQMEQKKSKKPEQKPEAPENQKKSEEPEKTDKPEPSGEKTVT